MGRKSYLGGSSILKPWANARNVENTLPVFSYTKTDGDPKLYFEKIDPDLQKELDGFDFDFIFEYLSALEHAVLHNDITSITRLHERTDVDLSNYVMRLTNELLINRKFDRKKGKIVIVKDTDKKLGWNFTKIGQVLQAMLSAWDEEFDDPHTLSATFLKMVESSN